MYFFRFYFVLFVYKFFFCFVVKFHFSKNSLKINSKLQNLYALFDCIIMFFVFYTCIYDFFYRFFFQNFANFYIDLKLNNNFHSIRFWFEHNNIINIFDFVQFVWIFDQFFFSIDNIIRICEIHFDKNEFVSWIVFE